MQNKRNSGARRTRIERGVYFRETPQGRRYEITYTDSTGRQRWQKVDGGIREARAARGDALAKLARGERVAPSKLTLAEYAAEWIDQLEGKCRPKTIDRYSTDLRLHVLPRLGRRKLASITVDDVASLLTDLQRTGYTRKG